MPYKRSSNDSTGVIAPMPLRVFACPDPSSLDPEREYPNSSAVIEHSVAKPTQPINDEFLYVEDASNLRTPPAGGLAYTTPGIYEIIQPRLQARMDFNEVDGKPVVGCQHDEEYNQRKSQWEFARLGKGWTIRSVYSDLYLAMGKPTGDGIPIVASEFPVSWHVQNGDISGVVKISWPGSEQFWGPTGGSDGRSIQIGSEYTQKHPEYMPWRLDFVGNPPFPDWNTHPEMPGARPYNRGPPLSDSSSDSDTGDSYQIVMTVTKTEKVSSRRCNRDLSLGDLGPGGDMDGSHVIVRKTIETSDVLPRRRGRGHAWSTTLDYT